MHAAIFHPFLFSYSLQIILEISIAASEDWLYGQPKNPRGVSDVADMSSYHYIAIVSPPSIFSHASALMHPF